MVRYYLYSLFTHSLLIIILFTTNAFNLTEPEQVIIYEEVSTAEENNNDDDTLNKLLEEQAKDKETRLEEVIEIIKEHDLDLSLKQIKNFSDLIVSSELDEEKVEELTKTYFENQPGQDNGNSLDKLKERLQDYVGGKEGDQELEIEEGSGGPRVAEGERENDLELPIGYLGSEIRHNMPKHEVFSEENKGLTKRNLEKLKIEETIKAIKNPYAVFEELNQKPAKYALLPEEPYEKKDTIERTQPTEFKSLGIGLAPRMNKEFVPDGSLDEWDLSQPMIPLNPVNEKVDPDFNAKIYLAWDFDEIFLAAEINDPTPVINKGYEWWTSNSLEVWFDALNRKLHQRFDSGCFQFWFAPYEPYFGKALGEHKFFSRDVPLKVKQTETGYIVEAVFRTDEELRYVEGLLGRVIGFHYFINSSAKASDGFEKRLFWITDKFLPGNVRTYTWMNPNSWGDVVFTGSAAEIYLTDEKFKEEYSHFGLNEINRVIIQDADRNLDPETQQFIKAFVRGKYSNDIEELVFVELTDNSSKFTAFVMSETSPVKPSDGKLQIQSGEPVEIVYLDQYTPNGFSKFVKKTIYTYYPVVVVK